MHFIGIYARIQANAFIYYLRQIPLLGNIFSDRIYQMYHFKMVFSILGMVFDFLRRAISRNVTILVFLLLLPRYLLGTDISRFAQCVLFLLLCCLAPAVIKSNIFKNIVEDDVFLNHFMLNPQKYYRYKIVRLYFENVIFVLPAVIFIFKDYKYAVVLGMAKLTTMALSDFFYIKIYSENGKLPKVKIRMAFSFSIYLLTYVLLYFIKPTSEYDINYLTGSIFLFFLLIFFYLSINKILEYKGYREIAVNFARQDSVELHISVSTAINEDETGISELTPEQAEKYYKENSSLEPQKYVNRAFINRYRKLFSEHNKQNIVFYPFLGILIGWLMYKKVVIITGSIEEYGTMVIPLAMNIAFGQFFYQYCYRKIDMPFTKLGINSIKEKIIDRMNYLVKLGIPSILSLYLGIVLMLLFARLSVSPYAILRVFLACFLVYIFVEEFNTVIYYLFKPYSDDVTVINPIVGVISLCEIVISIIMLFTRGVIYKMIVPLLLMVIIMTIFIIILESKLQKNCKGHLHKPNRSCNL